MSYLGTIKKLRLKTRWEEGTVDRRITGPEAQWCLLIDCGRNGWIGLKSIKRKEVQYYRPSGFMSQQMKDRLENIGAITDKCEGESMTTAPLAKLPELCKIVKARKKRKPLTEEQRQKAVERLKNFQFAPHINDDETGQE